MALRNPATVAVLFLFLLLIPSFTSAATGGRVGGRFFRTSKSSSSSSSHSSRHYYSPPTYHSKPSRPASSSWSGVNDCCKKGHGKLSVVKLQVGLMGKARSLQKDLIRITETANTSTPQGLSNVLTGVTTSLLCNLDHCISSYSSVRRESEIKDAEERFEQFSMEEVAKFDEVTLCNVDNFKTCSKRHSPRESHEEYMVVTILVATYGVLKLSTINGTRDLMKALRELGAIPSGKLMAAEILWTPQQEQDTLTQAELLKGYPELRGFYEDAFEGPYEDQQPFLGANIVV